MIDFTSLLQVVFRLLSIICCHRGAPKPLGVWGKQKEQMGRTKQLLLSVNFLKQAVFLYMEGLIFAMQKYSVL